MWNHDQRILGIVIIALLLATGQLTQPAQLRAQNAPAQPLIYSSVQGAGTTDTTGTIIDAYVYQNQTGGSTEICTAIASTWAYATSTGIVSPVIDARGFQGVQPNTCTQSPIPSTATGKLLLGNVAISTSATWVVPAGVELIGMGASGTLGDVVNGVPVNTVIQGSGLAAPIISLGATSCGGTCQRQVGAKVRSLTVDCLGVSGCTGIENVVAQEGSTVEDVTIDNAPVYGLHVTVGPASTPAANYSGIYRNITVQYLLCAHCTSTTNGIQVDCSSTSGCPSTLQFDNITASAANLGSGVGLYGFYIKGVSTLLTNSHFENYKVNIQIGDDAAITPTSNVKIENVSLSAGDVLIDTTASDVLIAGLSGPTSSTLLLQDNYHNSSSISGMYLGFYMLGKCNPTSCAGTYPAIVTSDPGTAWQEP
jgi:hypothetical protein